MHNRPLRQISTKRWLRAKSCHGGIYPRWTHVSYLCERNTYFGQRLKITQVPFFGLFSGQGLPKYEHVYRDSCMRWQSFHFVDRFSCALILIIFFFLSILPWPRQDLMRMTRLEHPCRPSVNTLVHLHNKGRARWQWGMKCVWFFNVVEARCKMVCFFRISPCFVQSFLVAQHKTGIEKFLIAL